MPEIILTQSEANALILMEKVKVEDQNWKYPSFGGRISIPLTSRNKRENFFLDICRGKIDLLKGTYQNRALQMVVLIRIDFGGQPHRNPDGQEISSPHLHQYREGYGDKWAVPVSVQKFQDINDKDLRQSGCELESKKRKDLLTLTLNGFGVKFEDDALKIHAFPENFAVRKHNLVQAMLAVNDLFYLAVPMISSLFLEDVTSWLNVYEVRYTPRVKFAGKSGYDHMFDFVIPASKIYPERILQAINRPNRDTVQSFAFSWVDTKDVRPVNSLSYALLNDLDHTPGSTVLDALKNYGVKPVLWCKREEVKEELAA